MALLLPPEQAKSVDNQKWIDLTMRLSSVAHKEVDLLNLRQVSTVLQKEVVIADRRIFTSDQYAADEFEMLILSYYQKLNAERAGVLAEFERTGKAYPV